MASIFLALPMVLLLVLLTPGDAAASAKNRTTVNLLPKAAKKLGAKQVRLVSTGLARGKGRQVRIPVRGGTVGARRANLLQAGGFEIRARVAGRRKVQRLRIGRLRLTVGKRTFLRGRPVGTRKEIALFTVRHGSRAVVFNRSTKSVRLRTGRMIPTGAMRRLLRNRLGLDRPRAVPVARLSSRANLKALELPPIPPPPLKPLPPEPEPLARPDSAVTVSSAQLIWCVRASWVRYTSTQSDPQVSGGASPYGPRVNGANACDQKTTNSTSALLQYLYAFSPRPGNPGWYDPVTKTAALYFTGGVRFRYPERGIDLAFNDPELEINGANTRLIFRIEGHADTEIASHRTVLTENGDPVPELDTTEPGSIKSPQMPGWLPIASGGGVFADFYLPPNHTFGWVSVEFSLPT